MQRKNKHKNKNTLILYNVADFHKHFFLVSCPKADDILNNQIFTSFSRADTMMFQTNVIFNEVTHLLL